ncbi:hypothetical protein ACSCBZ_39470 [Streptomyces niveiscabiei]|uniref:hypothetical protein n=1 Tax=Streptomyces niveiscabiei TaxID=164115 RepID=UPI0006EB48FF|nr:hypothetical protein [Streptomyces niveiscabiei]
MTDLSARPGAPASSPSRRLVAAGYVRRAPQLLASDRDSEILTAVRVAQRMLDTYGDSSGNDIYAYAEAHGALTEALRILLRAVDADHLVRRAATREAARQPGFPTAPPADPAAADEAVRRSVARAFPAIAAFLDDEAGETR